MKFKTREEAQKYLDENINDLKYQGVKDVICPLLNTGCTFQCVCFNPPYVYQKYVAGGVEIKPGYCGNAMFHDWRQ